MKGVHWVVILNSGLNSDKNNWVGMKPLNIRGILTLLLISLFIPLSIDADEGIEFTPSYIEVDGLTTMKKDDLLEILDIKKGKTLTVKGLRNGIKRAFRTRLFDEMTLIREENGLRIKLREREIIYRIRVKGNYYLSKKEILDAFIIKEGMPLKEELLKEARQSLIDFMHRKGFLKGDVNLKISKKKNRITITIHIKENEPLLIKNIEGPPDVVWRIRSGPDRPFDVTQIESDLEFIERYYIDEGYINPEVDYEFQDGILRFYVKEGKRLNINFSGNRKIDKGYLLEEIPFYHEMKKGIFTEITLDMLEEASRRLEDAMQRIGYLFADVSFQKEEDERSIDITFSINEGKRFILRSINFTGNSIDKERLIEIMKLREGSIYSPDKMRDGIRVLNDFLIYIGYMDAVIEEPEIRVDRTEGTVDVYINIKEGEKYIIKDIILKGDFHLSTETIIKYTGLSPGMAYNELSISDARERILQLLREDGYLDADVDMELKKDNGNISIIFNINGGRRYYFGKTTISGNLDTDTRVIRRERPYREGEPFRYSSLLEYRQRLYRLGLFREIELRTHDDEENRKDLHLEVKEAPQGAVELGIGYGEYERYRGFFDISYRNIAGMNRQISLRTELSTIEKRLILDYLDPRLFDSMISLRVTPMYEEREVKNFDTRETTYSVKRYSERTGIEIPYGKELKFSIYHELSLTRTYNVKPGITLPREDTGTFLISSIVPGIIYDTRDNPFDPRSGILGGGKIKFAKEFLFSEVEFIKFIFDISKYTSISKSIVLAMGVKTGIGKPIGKTLEIPVVERFFLGGRSSVRGYTQDSLGPKTTDGTPVGGNAFIQTNLELRFYPLRNLSFVVFTDGGNVFPRYNDISIDELRYTVGIGLRYNTPAGPIRLDYAEKLDRERGESKGELHFSLGHAF